jgi:hypothetical protein
VPDAAAVLNQLRTVIGELQIPSLHELGSIHLQPTSTNQPRLFRAGVHVLKPRIGSAVAPAHDPVGWTSTNTELRGNLRARSGEPGAVPTGSRSGFDARVVRYQNSELLDTAVILANEVVFDGDVIVLSDNVTRFIIVAETIRSTNGSRITWVGAGTTADLIAAPSQAPQGTPTYLSDDGTGGTFKRRNGGDGPDGAVGQRGNPGITAPDVFVFIKKFTREPNTTSSGDTHQASLPNMDLRGQAGGRGQRGQRGGDGGHGAKGRRAINGTFGDCKSGPGYGGHGGNGGNGGDGGQGGIGGNGGHVTIQYVKHPPQTNLEAAEFITSSGAGGPGGAGGLGGGPGDGGQAGNKSGNCAARPERRGDDGQPGAAGQPGPAGVAGADGSAEFLQMPLADWEAAFTTPYLVRGEDTHVGGTVLLETLNISGPARLSAVDDLDGTPHTFTITEVEEDKYEWAIPETMRASTYTVTLQRSHDEEESNSYRIELRPRIDGIRFNDEYDARPGGTAHIIGLGLRDDVEVLYDGIRIRPGPLQVHVDVGEPGAPIYRDLLEFTIPVVATDGEYFSRDSGETPHTVVLDQPYPLADSDHTTVTLKRTAGMKFLPSVNGFEFENHDMFDAACDYVTHADYSVGGMLRSFYGNDGFGGRGYELFRETYGAGEVDRLGGLVSPAVWANFGLWYNYWSKAEDGGTGTCFGLTTLSLHDFFAGVPTQKGKTINNLVRGISVLHERQVSDEILRLQVAETMLDGVGATIGRPSMTEIAARYIAAFLQTADDSEGQRYAPILLFLPSFTAYGDVLVQAANLIGETVNVWDDINPQEAWNDLDAAYHTMTRALKRSHAVTPYRVVYEDPTDSLPSRIYFYDNNKPGEDDVHLDIYREGGRVKFTYPGKYASDGSAESSTPGGFMLGIVPVGMALGNVDLLFDEDLLAPNLGLTAGEALYETLATMLNASKFLGGF